MSFQDLIKYDDLNVLKFLIRSDRRRYGSMDTTNKMVNTLSVSIPVNSKTIESPWPDPGILPVKADGKFDLLECWMIEF